MALPHPARCTYRTVAPPRGARPRLGSNWQKRLSEAATTMSPASAISIPIVNVMPCTAVTCGLRSRRPRPNGSTGSDACSSFRRAASRRASSLKNSGISSPAVVWSPANVKTPTNRSGSSSSRVSASPSSAVIFGWNVFFFSTRSTVITKTCPSTTSVRTSPWGCRSAPSDVDSMMELTILECALACNPELCDPPAVIRPATTAVSSGRRR